MLCFTCKFKLPIFRRVVEIPYSLCQMLENMLMKLINAEGLGRKAICAKNVSKLGFLLRTEWKLLRLVGEGDTYAINIYLHTSTWND